MSANFSPSVNIVRDAGKKLDYIVTPNAEKIAAQIFDDYKRGYQAFTIIGSYGTGKSSFLWALEQTLKGAEEFFPANIFKGKANVKWLNYVGEANSIIDFFAEQLDVVNDLKGNQRIFDELFQIAEKSDLLVIVIDEMGKFLEYAAKHNPEAELYFFQQLAEFVSGRNILFVTTLHQAFETYSTLDKEVQREEWRKIKGRFRELPFNEPVEQLLFLATKRISYKRTVEPKKEPDFYVNLIQEHGLFKVDGEILEKVGDQLYPLDLLSAIVLTTSLQMFGQKERSLFSFLESEDLSGEAGIYSLDKVYDYLLSNFRIELNSYSFNEEYAKWQAIQNAVERVEDSVDQNKEKAIQLIKIIGLLSFFSRPGASINKYFIKKYCFASLRITKTEAILDEFESRRIIHYSDYLEGYKIARGSNVDFSAELFKAGREVDEIHNVAQLLQESFDFPLVTAKAESYRRGTPRLFEYIISDKPVSRIPEGAIDGFINLIFDDKIDSDKILQISSDEKEAIVFGNYKNTGKVREYLFEIKKAERAAAEHYLDNVACEEFKAIQKHYEKLLGHAVIDGLYSGEVEWFFQGQQKSVRGAREFNQFLSGVCEVVYSKAPVFKNELVNRHKISASIHSARKNYFEALTEHWQEKDLGFEDHLFPPEKTIYISLLKQNGIHVNTSSGYDLIAPNELNGFNKIWKVSKEFLLASRREQQSINILREQLSKQPFKLKEGLVDFWVPTFLFVNRGDFALYRNDIFIPHLNKTILYELARNPQDYSLKTFEISEIRLKVFNKYREFLQQETREELTNTSFIESIRPFLVFYRELNDYAKSTRRLSAEALALRDAIVKAKDLEQTFFEAFPAALQFTLDDMVESDEALGKFARLLNEAIEEIKNAYAELLCRFEKYLTEEVLGRKISFPQYKLQLQKRFKGIKEHRLLRHQQVLINRVNSPLDDRDSWLASIGQALLNKPLHQIADKEEELLKDKLSTIVKELDNLTEISSIENDGDEVFKLEVTTYNSGLKTQNIIVSKAELQKINEIAGKIDTDLKTAGKNKMAVLAKLLNSYLK